MLWMKDETSFYFDNWCRLWLTSCLGMDWIFRNLRHISMSCILLSAPEWFICEHSDLKSKCFNLLWVSWIKWKFSAFSGVLRTASTITKTMDVSSNAMFRMESICWNMSITGLAKDRNGLLVSDSGVQWRIFKALSISSLASNITWIWIELFGSEDDLALKIQTGLLTCEPANSRFIFI